jgi:hypothetical protein
MFVIFYHILRGYYYLYSKKYVIKKKNKPPPVKWQEAVLHSYISVFLRLIFIEYMHTLTPSKYVASQKTHDSNTKI